MKFILGSLLLFFQLIVSAQTNNVFEITGKLENIQNSKATIVDYNRIPVEITNGAFNVKSEILEPLVVRFAISDDRLMKTFSGGGYAPVKSMHIWMILYPSAKIEVKGTISDFANAYAYDGGENDLLTSFNKELFPLLNSSVNIDLRLDYEKGKLSAAEKEKLTKEKESLDNKVKVLRVSFLEKNVSSIAGLWLMEDMVIRSQISMDEVDRLLTKVDKKYSSLSYYVSLVTRVKGYKAARVGQIAPDIISKATIDSTVFDLKSMRGKFVIIDFWGTWCGPCVAGMPKMKEFRDKHADKVQILGVAQDRNYDTWKKFVETKDMNWPNILSGKGEQDFVLKYNVQGFPTKLLISPKGEILYRFTGEEHSFYEEIEKLINK